MFKSHNVMFQTNILSKLFFLEKKQRKKMRGIFKQSKNRNT